MLYTVEAQIVISVFTEVEADSEREAISIAAQRNVTDLCASCANKSPDEEWVTTGELDGEPQKLTIGGAEVDNEDGS